MNNSRKPAFTLARAFFFIIFPIFMVFTTQALGAFRVFHYFEGLPENHFEIGWEGFNYNVEEGVVPNTTLYAGTKMINGQAYLCRGWKNGGNGIAATGSSSFVPVGSTDSVDRDLTWIYKKAYEIDVDVQEQGLSLYGAGSNSDGQLGSMTLADLNEVSSFKSQFYADKRSQSIAAGLNHSLVIMSDKTLYAWGDNSDGQLGIGVEVGGLWYFPIRIDCADTAEEDTWAAVAAGEKHTLAVRSDNTLWAWGSGADYQLDGSTINSHGTPHKLFLGTETIRQISAGRKHSVLLYDDGSLWVWGANDYGQVGTSSTVQTRHLISNNENTDWETVDAGALHTAGIDVSGQLWVWGRNANGILGDGTMENQFTPKKIGTDTHWLQVSAGSDHTAAIKSDGTLWTWGSGYRGKLGHATENIQTIPKQVLLNSAGLSDNDWAWVCAGTYNTLAIKQDGTLWISGHNQFRQLGNSDSPPYTLTFQRVGQDQNWLNAVAGQGHVVGQQFDESTPVFSVWGKNDLGQVGDASWENRSAPVKVHDWKKISAGKTHTLAIHSNGTLWAWGGNDYGQVGNGLTSPDVKYPTPISNQQKWVDVATGWEHSLALDDEDRLFAWGGNDSGQLGNHGVYLTPAAWEVSIYTGTEWVKPRWKSLATGAYHSMAILKDYDRESGGDNDREDEVFAWGKNDRGQTGTTKQADRSPDPANPVSGEPVVSPTNVVNEDDSVFKAKTISAGYAHSLAISDTGLIYTWGDNTYYQSMYNASPFRTYPFPNDLFGINWDKISAGSAHNLAINTDGELYAWGYNAYGQLGLNHTENRSLPTRIGSDSDVWVAVDGGDGFSLALKQDGTLWSWGANNLGQLGGGVTQDDIGINYRSIPGAITIGLHWEAITAGYTHAGAIGKGMALFWGDDSNYQTGSADKSFTLIDYHIIPKVWKTISSGRHHTLAIAMDNSLWAWGRNWCGQLGNGKSGNAEHSNVPVQISSDTNWRAVAAGGSHSMALKADGSLWTWGLDLSGQLGYVTTETVTGIADPEPWDNLHNSSYDIGSRPYQIHPGPFKKIATGGQHSLAIHANGSLWAWGRNWYGQLGVQEYQNQKDYMHFVGSANDIWTTIACGEDFSAGIKADGTLWTWGANTAYQLGQSRALNVNLNVPGRVGSGRWLDVSAGVNHGLAIRSDGTLWAWGQNTTGQTGIKDIDPVQVPLPVVQGKTWKAIDAGEYHSAAVRSDGTLWTWGAFYNSRLGLPGITKHQLTPAQVLEGTTWFDVSAGAIHTLALKADSRVDISIAHDGDGSATILPSQPDPVYGVDDGKAYYTWAQETSPGESAGYLTQWKNAFDIPVDAEGIIFNGQNHLGNSVVLTRNEQIIWQPGEKVQGGLRVDIGVDFLDRLETDNLVSVTGTNPEIGTPHYFFSGSSLTLYTAPVVNPQGEGTWICTGWTGGAGNAALVGTDNQADITALDQDTSLTWTYAEARSLTLDYGSLPENFRKGAVVFSNATKDHDWTVGDPVWFKKGGTAQLTLPRYITEPGGSVRYKLVSVYKDGVTTDTVTGSGDAYTPMMGDNMVLNLAYERQVRLDVYVISSSTSNVTLGDAGITGTWMADQGLENSNFDKDNSSCSLYSASDKTIVFELNPSPLEQELAEVSADGSAALDKPYALEDLKNDPSEITMTTPGDGNGSFTASYVKIVPVTIGEKIPMTGTPYSDFTKDDISVIHANGKTSKVGDTDFAVLLETRFFSDGAALFAAGPMIFEIIVASEKTSFRAQWPSNPVEMVTGAPVNLDPPGSVYQFERVHYTDCDGILPDSSGNSIFHPSTPGNSVVRFSDPQGNPVFVVVSSNAVDPGAFIDQIWDIGTPITPKSGITHSDPEGKTGYVYYPDAHYDGALDDSNHTDQAYVRSIRQGRIIPVNKNVSKEPNRDLVVVWYETDAYAPDPEITTEPVLGLGWPKTPVRYTCDWPVDPDTLVIADPNGSGNLPEIEHSGRVYVQNDPDMSGYNPNEEHAHVLGDTLYALRSDLNTYKTDTLDESTTDVTDDYVWSGPEKDSLPQLETSRPYVLFKYRDPAADYAWTMKIFKVEITSNDHDFTYPVTAGTPILPLPAILGLPLQEKNTMFTGGEWYFEDHKGGHWAMASDGLETNSASIVTMHWYYPLQDNFYYPLTDMGLPVPTGAPVPFLNGGTSHQTPPRDLEYPVSWPVNTPRLAAGETLIKAKNGLPEVGGMAAAHIIFDQTDESIVDGNLAILIDPYSEREVFLNALPGTIKTESAGAGFRFPDLPATLQERFLFEPDTVNPGQGRLIFLGTIDESGTGEPLVLLNIMSQREKSQIMALSPDTVWTQAVDNLFDLTQTQLAGDLSGLLNQPKALTAGCARNRGYLVLAENNDPELNDAPVSLHVMDVGGDPYRGEIKVLAPDNVFDESLTLRHSGDFGGEPERFYFRWYYKESSDGISPNLPPDNDLGTGWTLFSGQEGWGVNDITISGAGTSLVDKWVMVRYYHGYAFEGRADYVPPYPYDPGQTNATPVPNTETEWSGWAGAPGFGSNRIAQLAPGWIKRVTEGLNLFDSRIDDFRDNQTQTLVSMIAQLGERWEGDIALNSSADNLMDIGLIQAYQTMLNRGKELSIDQGFSYADDALLYAATRIADFYLLLGNEAYADALDPFVGLDTGDPILSPALFAFQNQTESLLTEELSLLRGRDDNTGASPVYNRLFWNFTNGDGETAYASGYNITDLNIDGFIDEKDAKQVYPQGHGDAWGHYLTALKTWYGLMRHPEFDWSPQVESVLVGDSPVTVDFRDERKFARAAAAKARTGSQILDLTFRESFVDNPAGQWQGYRDTEADRAWGMDGWARRTGQGALFDWAVANAMLPADDNVHTGIEKIDRTTVSDLYELAGQFLAVQAASDKADQGLNPLGLARGAVPFDINPALVTPYTPTDPQTHFEQIHDRAVTALNNAVDVFEYGNQYTRQIRANEDSLDDFKRTINEQERDYLNRLIEIFGYAYDGDTGPGKTYPSGYAGPDWLHFNYADLANITGDTINYTRQVPVTAQFSISADGLDPPLGIVNSEMVVTFYLDESQPWAVAPQSWGSRRSPGEIQLALSDVIQAHRTYMKGLSELDGIYGEMTATAGLLESLHGVRTHQVSVLKTELNTVDNLQEEIFELNQRRLRLMRIGETAKDLADIISDSLPKTIMDIAGSAQSRAGMKTAAYLASNIIKASADIMESEMMADEHEITRAGMAANLQLTVDDARYEVLQLIKELECMGTDLQAKVQELYVLREVINQHVGRYQSLLAKGQRVLAERETFRQYTAADIQDYRYQDMAFRVFRNQALEKYRAAFDLAAQYTYLAGTAFDYETNFLGSDPASAARFFEDIVKQRSLGAVNGGNPIAGIPGLADPLARMGQDFTIYKTQLGFNNPQTETNRFSLRRELFRLKDGSNEAWKNQLELAYKDNLWDVPEFSRFCRPFAPEYAGPQPGLVIDFNTEVSFGRNFFGWPLAGGDSSYDPTNFATKVRSVGVWFENYDGSGLSYTPRVYLVPTGTDVLRSPSGDGFATREWQVSDQKLPVPYSIGASDLSSETWIPVQESLTEEFGEIRRHASFRAYHDGGFDLGQMTYDSRLIGRSVWNTQWKLIIPGGTLLYDSHTGLDNFMNNVDDIKLFFQTYSYSGY